MIREQIKDFKGLDHDPDFRWRGTNVTRIENLSDIIFALALGMLISGVDAPRDIVGLREFLWNIFPTALGFTVLLGLWHGHYTFFRRYGVADRTIIFLNAVLIFVVLFMAYPLRFAFDSLFAFITADTAKSVEMGVMTWKVAGEFVAFFSLAYAVAFLIFALMYGHILKKADLLSLNAYEIAITKQTRLTRYVQFSIALFTAGMAYWSPLYPVAGLFHCFFFLAHWLARKRYPSNHLMESHADT